MIANNSCFKVFGWMRTGLYLKGNELITYAIIYDFTKKEGWFSSNLTYLAEWIGVTVPTACLILKELTKKGLILKEPNGINCYKYKTNSDKLDFLALANEPAPDIAPAPVKEKVAKKPAPKKDIKPVDESNIFEEYAKEDKELLNKLKDFEQFRKDIKAPLTTLAKKQLVNKLERECVDRSERIEVLGESILKNWKGIFPNSLPSRKQNKGYEQKKEDSSGLIPGIDYFC